MKSKTTAAYRILFCAAISIIAYLATAETSYPVICDINDKFSHIIAFLVLAFLADFSFPDYPYNFLKIIPLFVYGVFIEIAQYFIPNRQFSFYDMLANLTGLLLFILLPPVLKKIPIIRERWESGT